MLARTAIPILFASLVLAGCSVSVGPTNPFPDAISTNATSDPLEPAVSGQLGGRSSVVYKVDLAAAAADDLVYLELDQDLDLTVYRANGAVYASSDSSDGFASGLTGLALQVSDVAQQAIGVEVMCRGSCVISNSLGGSAYVKIENPNASPKNYSLFAFGEDYADLNEPANDVTATAPTLGASDKGALETLGDVDFFAISTNGAVSLSTKTDVLPIRASINGTTISIEDGGSMNVVAGDVIRVAAEGGTQAAAAAISGYTLTFAPGAAFPGAVAITANSDSMTPVRNENIGSNETYVYKVDLRPAAGSDVVYLELGSDLDLTVYTGAGTPFASSSSADGFASGLSGLGAATSALGQQAIGLDTACRGSCVIANSLGDTAYVEVHNPGSATSFSLYVFGDDYADATEPANDNAASAPSLTTNVSGAIETLGDVDYFKVESTGAVRFALNASSTLDVRVTVVGLGTELQDGQSYMAVAGDILRVEVVGGAQAGAAAVSGYTLAFVV